MAIFTGSGVAIVTPMTKDGNINYDALKELIEFQIKNSTDAIIACGTTGEASTLTDEEQIEIIRYTVSVVNKRVPVVAGAGSNYTDHGVALCRDSQKAGADACLVVTPYYNKCTQRGLIEHYRQIAGSIDIPVIMYNVPSRTGLNIDPKTVYELSKVENITAIKEASENITQVAEIAELCGDSLDIYSGCDNQIVPVLSLGGKGVISVLANIMPKETHNMVYKYLNGDTKGSLKIQLWVMGLVRALFCEVNPIPVKAALNMLGLDSGCYRMPLCSMDPINHERLRREMVKVGLLSEHQGGLKEELGTGRTAI